MSERNLSGLDIVQALRESNVLVPTGNAKLGDKDVQIVTDALVPKVEEMNEFPIRSYEGVEIKTKDVAKVEDSHQIQTNIVRISGKRQVYIPIYRQPGANTIQVVDSIKKALSSILERLPKGMHLDVAQDQSIFIRRAIQSLSHEVILGGILAALMVLLFLRSFRSSMAVFLTRGKSADGDHQKQKRPRPSPAGPQKKSLYAIVSAREISLVHPLKVD